MNPSLPVIPNVMIGVKGTSKSRSSGDVNVGSLTPILTFGIWKCFHLIGSPNSIQIKTLEMILTREMISDVWQT